MPANSVLLIDESSAALASRVGHGVSVSSFVEMNLKNTASHCVVVYMSAQDRSPPPSSATVERSGCRSPRTISTSERLRFRSLQKTRTTSASRRHVWDDYP